MASDMTGEQMQAKITAARREAEGLKDKIKRRKDELADTSRMPISSFAPSSHPPTSILFPPEHTSEATRRIMKSKEGIPVDENTMLTSRSQCVPSRKTRPKPSPESV